MSVERTADPLPVSQVPYGLTRATSSPPSSPSPTGDGRPEVYFVGPADELVPRSRPGQGSTLPRRLAGLLGDLTAGPSRQELARQLTTDLGPDLTLQVLAVDRRTATIGLGATADLPTGRDSRLAVAQIVLTATSLPGIDAVTLTRNGDRVEAPLPGGELRDGPLTAADYAGLVVPAAPTP